jgi:PAS domain S-box-containing protein
MPHNRGRTYDVQLAHSEERLRLLVESVTDYAIFMLDSEGFIVSWNPGAQRMKGYSEAEIIGQHFSVFYTPEDIQRNHPANELILAVASGRYEEEGWRVRKDGTRFFCNVVITPVLETDGTLRGFAKVTRDVTQRRTLEESEHRYKLLVDSVSDYAIFMLDTEGRIASWNAGAKNIKGYDAEEIIGQHFSKFYTDEDLARDYPAEELKMALRDGSFEDEGWRIRKDGSHFWANVVITPIFDKDHRLTGFAKVTRDITQRKDLEVELRELNRQLESFAYSVAHDLRAPLRAVAFSSRILLNEATDRLDEEHKDLLEMQHSSAVKLAKIVDDLLQLAKISRLDIGSESVNITDLASKIIEEISSKGQNNGCSFDVEEGLFALGDATLMHVILWNLINNAYKFSPHGGLIRVGYDSQGKAFFVSDEGIGFEMEYAHKVFLPFERLVTEKEFAGTGIGLANVHRAVTRQGGRIWVESEPGEGTTFFFSLPKTAVDSKQT